MENAKNPMHPRQQKSEAIPQLVQRRGFYLDILKYADTAPLALNPDQAQCLMEAYDKLKSPLGHVSYTDIARVLGITPLEVMQHVKHMHVHSKEWDVRFSNNRHNENVFFKLLKKSRPA
jgi:hypothetical protein